MDLNTCKSAGSNVSSHIDTPPDDDNPDDMHNTSHDSRLNIPNLHTPVFSGSTQSTPQLRQDIVLSTGDKYVITFRGSAHYLEHKNFQYFTDNVHMKLHDVKSLITSILIDSQTTLIFYFATCPSTTTELRDLHLILPKLSHICFSLEVKPIHIDAMMSDGQQFLLGWFTVEKVGDPSSLPYRPRNGYYYTNSWYQEIQTIGIPPDFKIILCPSTRTSSLYLLVIHRNVYLIRLSIFLPRPRYMTSKHGSVRFWVLYTRHQ
jgi:hypothetical protein